MFKFFYAKEAEQYLFYRIPQMLFTEEKFRLMSCEAKVLYGLLLDRVGLSRRNGWADDEGRLYIYFTQDEACEKLNVGKNKITRIFIELEKVGLIQRQKQGLCKPTKIYVLNFAESDDDTSEDETEIVSADEDNCNTSDLTENQSSDFSETTVRNSQEQTSGLPESKSPDSLKVKVRTPQKQKSGLPKSKSPDSPKTNPNHTNINHNNKNHTDYQSNLSIHHQPDNAVCMSKADRKEKCDRWSDEERNSYLSYIRQNLGYDEILQTVSMDKSVLDMAVQIILEAYNPENEYIVIQGQSYPQTVVREKFEKLDSTHIRYVWQCLQETVRTQKIKNLRKYLQACLFNAPDTIDFYYNNQRQYDSNSVLNSYSVSKSQPKMEKRKASYDISFIEDPKNWKYFLD